MSDYPEHDKLRKVLDESQAIGLFLDHGLPEQGLVLYEVLTDKYNGRKQWVPAQRTIQSILAAYFGIDEEKLTAEKDAIYRSMAEHAK